MTMPINLSDFSAQVEEMLLVPAHQVVKYAYDFEAGADSWVPANGALQTSQWFGTQPPGGGSAVAVTISNAAGLVTLKRTVTGLTAGRTYTFEAYAWANNFIGTSTDIKIGVTGKAFSAPITPGSWTKVTYAFTATATSHELIMASTASGATARSLWDLPRLLETVPDEYGPFVLDVLDGDWELNDSRAPYVEARLTCAVPAEAMLEQIDARDDLRVTFTSSQEWVVPIRDPQTRSADLRLSEREVDHNREVLVLTLHSDEAALIDAGNDTATVDSSAEANQTSLRAIVNAKLAAHGAALEPGTVDARFTITSNRSNLALNPRAFSTASPWAGSAGTTSRLTGLTIPGLPGVTTAIRHTANSAASGGPYTQADVTSPFTLMAAGKLYRVTAWLRPSVARSYTPSVQFSNGTSNIGSVNGTPVALPANVWTRVSWVVTAPAGAVRGGAYWYSVGNLAVGNTTDVTGLTVTEGTDDVSFFDGAFSDPDYTYSWAGTAHASSSTRTRLDDRSPDILKQEPGESDWDFLAPLVQAAGLRLFCDEQRVWRLVDPIAYSIEGMVQIAQAVNLTQASDVISRQTDAWFDAVVIRYFWTDAEGVQQEAFDAASSGGTKLTKAEINRPFPGPGAAALRLAWYTGRGRTLRLAALSDLAATPGKGLVATLPGAPIQVGVVTRVRWLWSAESTTDVMEIDSRGLVDTPANAWLFAAGSWAAATGTWAGATGSN